MAVSREMSRRLLTRSICIPPSRAPSACWYSSEMRMRSSTWSRPTHATSGIPRCAPSAPGGNGTGGYPMRSRLMDLLFPPRCVLCRHGLTGKGPLCPDCAADIRQSYRAQGARPVEAARTRMPRCFTAERCAAPWSPANSRTADARRLGRRHGRRLSAAASARLEARSGDFCPHNARALVEARL